MAVQELDRNLQPLHRAFATAQWWFWWQRGLRTLVLGLCGSLGFAMVAALLAAWQAPPVLREGFWAASGLTVLLGMAAALVLRPSRTQAVRVVDRHLDLQQQLGTAEELLGKGAGGSLVEIQLARASELAGDLPIAKAFPLLPRRELAVGLLLAAVTGALLLMVSLGILLPNPLSAFRLPSFLEEAATPVQQEVLGARQAADLAKPRSAALASVRQMLADLRDQSDGRSLSPSAAAAALAQASGELNRVADESRVRQEALESLASQLRGTATGREVANSLRQGDYDRAAQQLQELGRQSDQLSPQAKRELSEALQRAAASSQSAQDLARSERKAADALRQGDYSSVVQSMAQLAGAVKDAANETVPQSELADTWQQLEQVRQQLGGLGLDNQQGMLAPPVAQSPQAAGERSMALEQNQSSQPGDGSGPGDPNGQTAGGQPAPGAGTPGSSRGGAALGQERPPLGVDGRPLDVEGQIGDRFPGTGEPGTQPPSVLRQGTANSVASSEGTGTLGPISVPAENVLVPGDRRSMVRDYFSKGSGGQ